MNFSFAQELYKQQDASGRIIYSSKPKEGDIPHVLPTIARKNIEIVADKTCMTHGGNSCESGPDTDGSVICMDGYKEALSRFNFNCRTAKLSIVNKNLTSDGLLRVVVRNSAAALAKDVSVEYKHKTEFSNTFEKLIGIGPEKINGFESGDYLFNLPNSLELIRQNIVDKFEITCENCG
jgi:hypothetical protein